ncbi:hypothetical protein [Geothrix sp. PMB-07]|uniref:hypothetical protein n=1 Tax=Geothrix sp. PMB-07 TaxID=3068640 RepID=UPI0027418323|nr:hypothetical protein [Geothrix sp. PMB-07]WLT30665.1 hypothetical protein Q9293_13165 [Geothrix sp. PMB-07]
MRNLDVAVLTAFDLSELLDDEGVNVSPTRVRSHMASLVAERPDLVSRVTGRWAWVVKLAGYPDLAS